MTLLAVVRLGRYSAAGEALGINHSTVSRRLAALEKAVGGRLLSRTQDGWEATALGTRVLAVAEEVEAAVGKLADDGDGLVHGMLRVAAPEAFTTQICVPAAVRLRERHPAVEVELISATQRVRQSRSGVDIEVVVNKPLVHKAVSEHIGDYALGLYASPEWLAAHGTPRRREDLAGVAINYYVDSMLQVDELDMAAEELPGTRRGVRSTSVFAHVAATEAGGGVGILPDFLARGAEERGTLVRVLPEEYSYVLSYWAVVRQEALRSPLVAAGVEALRAAARAELAGA
ncbi:LysR family transcriptional regulator [Arthrobacter sp. UM1]|nr:LysR family transcriptional regulator [Arthrobacter sp. UM1]